MSAIQTIEKIFRVAPTKKSEYYVVLGSCKQAVPPAAEIVKSVNSKTEIHYFESPSAVGCPSVPGLALAQV